MPRGIRLRLLFATLIAVATAFVIPRPAAAFAPGDTLTLIWKPLPNLPAIARLGDSFTVWANAPSSASGWAASLRLGALAYPLTMDGGGWDPTRGWWVMSFHVPGGGIPEETYDLELSCTTCGVDVARHAVKVLPQYQTDWYFAQISDTHLPSHAFSSDFGFSTADTSGMPDFSAVIEDLNLLHPEFIIHTGDLVNEGELEDYLSMFEMGRAQQMLTRLRDPIFVSTGNHDIGGWQATPPADGTSRKAWWRTFGWSFLGAPPPGEPFHSQNFSFDYGLVHCIGLEAYINNGGYDQYRTDVWGAQSFTGEQMFWLESEIGSVPPGHSKLLFYHYDFGGTNGDGSPAANFSQISPAALGLDGAIWGHNHVVPEGNLAARPFNLGLQAVIDGRRAFRIFRVHGAAITPGPMHYSGGSSSRPVDSLRVAWSGPNNGTRTALSATVTNLFGETWERGRLVFALLDRDSSYLATGGTIAQIIRQGGIASVYVDCVFPARGAATVTVAPSSAGVGPGGETGIAFGSPSPNPYRPGQGAVAINFSLPAPSPVNIVLYDLHGRVVATLFDGPGAAGTQPVLWDGHTDSGETAPPGIYLLRLRSTFGERERKLAVLR